MERRLHLRNAFGQQLTNKIHNRQRVTSIAETPTPIQQHFKSGENEHQL